MEGILRRLKHSEAVRRLLRSSRFSRQLGQLKRIARSRPVRSLYNKAFGYEESFRGIKDVRLSYREALALLHKEEWFFKGRDYWDFGSERPQTGREQQKDLAIEYLKGGQETHSYTLPLFDGEAYTAFIGEKRLKGCNPLVHYIVNRNRCDTLSCFDIAIQRRMADILGSNETCTPYKQSKLGARTQTVGVFIHCFYTEEAQLIATRLEKLTMPMDIYISTVQEHASSIKRIFNTLGEDHRLEVIVVQNRGRDICPFVTTFASDVQKHEYVLKLHTKRSPHGNRHLSEWLDNCLDNLIGSDNVVTRCLDELELHDVGIVYPVEIPEIAYCIARDGVWGGHDVNIAGAVRLGQALGIHEDSVRHSKGWKFPIGSMFWAKSTALEPVFRLQLKANDFEPEAGQIDGTLAHVIERFFGFAALELKGLSTKSSFAAFGESKRAKEFFSIVANRNRLELEGLERYCHLKPQDLSMQKEPSRLKEISESRELDIHWVIPNFKPGLGGHMTIFRAIQHLERSGHNCTIWIHSVIGRGGKSKHSLSHKLLINQHYLELSTDQVYLLGDTEEELGLIRGDIIVATDRISYAPVVAMGGFRKRCYFVQDYECYFYPHGSEHYLIEETYKNKDIHYICASSWLAEKMRDNGSVHTNWFPLAVDQSEYYPLADGNRIDKQIAVYIRPSTPRRLYGLAMLALCQLYELGGQFTLVYFGEETENRVDLPVRTKHLGVLSRDELRKLYQESHVGLVLSGTNYSLIPLEMMACGLPVVDIDAPHTRASYGADGIPLLARPNPTSIALTLSRLLRESHTWEDLSQRGIHYASEFTWEKSMTIATDAITTNHAE